MPKRYNNIIYKLFLRSKKTIKVTLSSITRIKLIIYKEDPKKAPGIDYVYIKEDTVMALTENGRCSRRRCHVTLM
jgi:hypothetical protein